MENSHISFLLLYICFTILGGSAQKTELYDDGSRGYGISNHINRYLKDSFWTASLLNNSQCRRDMDLVQREAADMNLWALKMLDASAKLPSGIISGNLNQFGDFDECLSAQSRSSNVVKGKYCLTTIGIKTTSGMNKNPKIQELDDAIHSHRMLTNELLDHGHRIPKFETFVWGTCVPSSCSGKEVETAVGLYLKEISKGTTLRFDVIVNEEVCYVHEEKSISATKLLVISLFGFIFLLSISDLVFDVNSYKKDHPKAAAIVQCFSIRKNWRTLMTTKSEEDDIQCLHGARFLNAIALLLSHKQIAMIYSPMFNRTAMSEAFSKSWTMVGRSAILYTDSFIMISGILTSYSFVKNLDRNKSIEFKDKLINRLIRFTPNLMGIILFCTYLMDDMNSGPQWGLVVSKYANLCKKNMWRNFLYIHNYFGFENMCLTHTHQLGIDMQLFLASPVLVYILWKSPKFGTAILLAISSLSTWLRYDVTQRENLSTMIYYGISVEQLWRTANLSYILPTHRLTVYITGLMVGYFLRRKGKNLTFNSTLAALGWILAVVAALIAVFGLYKSAHKGYVYDPVIAAQFNAFAPILWTIFISWCLFACVNGYGGIFNSFLSWKYFKVFTKISYSVYLTQFPVFFYGIGTERTMQFYNGFYSMFDLPEFVIVLIASIALTLAFDIPCQELKKVLWKSHKYKKNEEKSVDYESGENIKNYKTRRRLQFYGT